MKISLGWKLKGFLDNKTLALTLHGKNFTSLQVTLYRFTETDVVSVTARHLAQPG